ncbi:MAG: hypothetical protein IPI65_22250 [Bacteroidetes bacterium]|nr:hypothetical protein [Bacteroidota bacterium]
MKALFVLFLICCSTLNAQVERYANSGIGTGGGAKMHYGAWGVFYAYNLKPFHQRLELNAGIGLASSYAAGAGINFRIFDNAKWFETYLSVNYSYWAKGQIRYELDELNIDYYNISALQFLQNNISARFWLDKTAAIQINIGYSDNIAGYKIVHIAGPNQGYNNAVHYAKSGMLVGLDIIVFPFTKGVKL